MALNKIVPNYAESSQLILWHFKCCVTLRRHNRRNLILKFQLLKKIFNVILSATLTSK